MKILFIVQGLFEKSDSIGYDCFFQYMLCRESFPEHEVRIFSERFDADRYPHAKIESIDIFIQLINNSENIVIYHYCDGWPYIEKILASARCRTVVRWHNNTPPWFFSSYSIQSVERTLNGFSGIIKMARSRKIFFSCNSEFTGNQLKAISACALVLPKVFPASKYLAADRSRAEKPRGIDHAKKRLKSTNSKFYILFVGRVVAHKGHKHVISIANQFQKLTGLRTVVQFPGRHDPSAPGYLVELEELSRELDVDVRFPGEIDDIELERMYEQADVFMCMSEHEGFGLPIYEAMTKNVPVAVWETTAFSEIMNGHALSFPRMDHGHVAHQIARLQDASFRREVLSFQDRCILPEYSLDVVRHQIIRCINTAVNYHIPESDDEISSDINVEIPHNYVTRYDLDSYTSMLNATQRNNDIIGSWTSQYIDAAKFSFNGGRIGSKRIVFEEICSEKHLVFGPYMELKTGTYRVTFDVELDKKQHGANIDDGLIFKFDVAAGTVLAQDFIKASDISADLACTLEFVVESAVNNVEFRIASHTNNKYTGVEINFYGVLLSKLMPSFLVGRRPIMRRLATSTLIQGSGGATVVKIVDLLKIVGDEDFLEKAYGAIFGRSVDEGGRKRYLKALKTNEINRSELIEILSGSEEGSGRRLFFL